MCGKYTLIVGFLSDTMEKFVQLCNQSPKSPDKIIFREDGQIQPGDCAPALMVASKKVDAVAMRWGFTQTEKKLVINARSETAAQKPLFASLTAYNRCALPAFGYYEWRDLDHLKHLISLEEGRPLYLAGLYRPEEDGLHFVVLTREAFGEHAQIHRRMPLVLTSREDARRWLDGAMPIEELRDRRPEGLCVQPAEPEQLRLDSLLQSDCEE